MLDYCKLVGNSTDHDINAACAELSNQLGRIEQIEAQEQLTSVDRRVMELEATESIISKFLTHCSNPKTITRLNFGRK